MPISDEKRAMIENVASALRTKTAEVETPIPWKEITERKIEDAIKVPVQTADEDLSYIFDSIVPEVKALGDKVDADQNFIITPPNDQGREFGALIVYKRFGDNSSQSERRPILRLSRNNKIVGEYAQYKVSDLEEELRGESTLERHIDTIKAAAHGDTVMMQVDYAGNRVPLSTREPEFDTPRTLQLGLTGLAHEICGTVANRVPESIGSMSNSAREQAVGEALDRSLSTFQNLPLYLEQNHTVSASN